MPNPSSTDSILTSLGPAFVRAKVGMCLTDQDGRVVAVNPELTKMLEMREEEIVGHSFLAFVPKHDRRAARSSFEAVVQGGYLEQPDWHVRLRDGRLVWVRVQPSRFDIDESPHILSVLTDVTPSRLAEAARQSAEHRARGLMESNVIGVMEWTVDGTMVDANESFARLLGYGDFASMPHGLEWQQITPSEYSHADREAMRELLETGSCRPYAKEFYRRDSSRAPVLVASTRLSDGRYVTYVLDRTESRLIEAALREGQETLLKVLDTALDAVVLLDANGLVIAWRGSSERLLGWDREEAKKAAFVDLVVSERFREVVREGIERFIHEGASDIVGNRVEIEVVRKDGEHVPVELSMSAATSGGKTIFCAFLHDLTRRKAAEEQTRNLNRILEAKVEERTEELRVAFEELERFSYSVSHDLRAPLRSINGFATLVITDYGDQLGSDGIETLKRIMAASKRMARLIDDLLGFARLARVELRRSDVDLTKLATAVANEEDAEPKCPNECDEHRGYRVPGRIGSHAALGEFQRRTFLQGQTMIVAFEATSQISSHAVAAIARTLPKSQSQGRRFSANPATANRNTPSVAPTNALCRIV